MQKRAISSKSTHFFSLLKWKENLDSCVLTQELLEANIKCPMPLEGWKTSRNPFVSKHKNIPPKAHFLSRGFIKCRKESSVGYPLLQNHLSPYPNPSRRICWAVHHIPVLVTLLCPQQIQTRGFPESHGCQSLHKTAWALLPSWQLLLHFKVYISQCSAAWFSSWQCVTHCFVFMPGSPTDLLGLWWFILITQIRNKLWKTEISA